MLKLYHYTY